MPHANAPLGRFLVASVIALTLGSAAVSSAMIIGPGQITASTSLPNSGFGFTIDQMCDGILVVPGWYNGFAAVPGLVGTIRLDLTTPQDLGDFVLWNDINVAVEGIRDFRLDFFDAANLPLGSTPVLTGPLTQTAPAIYAFSTVSGVKRVDLVVINLNPSQRLEIREVAFNWSDVVATESSTWSQLKALYR